MIKKKAQINKIFVYLLSIIMIVFVGFLVIKFSTFFLKETSVRSNSIIYNNLQQDLTDTYKVFDSQNVEKFKVSSSITWICFIPNNLYLNKLKKYNFSLSEINDINISIIAKSNVFLFDNKGFLSSRNIGTFNIENNPFCIKPSSGFFKIIMTNKNNKVFFN